VGADTDGLPRSLVLRFSGRHSHLHHSKVPLSKRPRSVWCRHPAVVECPKDGHFLFQHWIIRRARRHGWILRSPSRTGICCLAYLLHWQRRRFLLGSRDIRLGHVCVSFSCWTGHRIVAGTVSFRPVAEPLTSLDAAMTLLFHIGCRRRGASEFHRWPEPKVVYVILSSTE
jgi:hypothetical protein